MTHGFDSGLLRLLQAAQEQKSTFAAELKRIADRCYAEHVTTTASETTKAAIRDDDVDTEMTDADVQSTEVEGKGILITDKAKTSDFYCRTCYDDILTLVHHTYASPAQPQWYDAQKTTFLAELDRRLESVRALRAPLDVVDEWITAQFHAWLRNQLQDAVALQTLMENWDADKETFQACMADSALTVPELLREIIAKAGSFVNGDQVRVVADAETAAKNLQDTSSTAKKSAIFLGSLYPDGVPDLPAVRAIEKQLLDGTMGLEEGMSELVRDIYDGEDEGALAAKTEKHRKRLAEMRRAKAAHEAQKLKKMKPVDVPYFLQDDTSCAACRKASDPQKSPFCMVCFLEVDYCLRQNQTVWCTTTCMKENYVSTLDCSLYVPVKTLADRTGTPSCGRTCMRGWRPLLPLQTRSRRCTRGTTVLFLP